MDMFQMQMNQQIHQNAHDQFLHQHQQFVQQQQQNNNAVDQAAPKLDWDEVEDNSAFTEISAAIDNFDIHALNQEFEERKAANQRWFEEQSSRMRAGFFESDISKCETLDDVKAYFSGR